MKIGLQIPNFTWPGGSAEIAPTLTRIAQTADQGGFNSIWVMDHFFQIPNVGQIEEPMLESYSTLNFLAGKTQSVRLGTMVTGVIYRHPAILAKQVSTLDVLSGGRAYLGIGAAWNEVESRSLGIPFPPVAERFRRLEEALQIILQMWSGDETPFEGQYYHLERPLNHPQPISKPRPPILIGGVGEKKTLRLVAQYADACNIFARMGDDVLRHKLDVLRQHCEQVGRPYDDIEKTALSFIYLAPGQMSTGDVLDHFRSLFELGFQQVIFSMPNIYEITPLEAIIKEVVPEIKKW